MSIKKLLFTAIASLSLAQIAVAQTDQPKPPNIIVILGDDIGFNDIEPFGQTVIQTPELNKLAAEGMRFTNYHVHPTCSPTRAQLMTGVDNHLAGMGAMGEYRTPEMDNYPGSYIGSLNEKTNTIAEALKENGYFTFITGKWHLGAKPEQLPEARGFDKSYILISAGGSHWDDSSLVAIFPKNKFSENGKIIPRDTGEYSSDLYTNKFISYIQEAEKLDKPFFGFLSFQAAHDPLHAPADFIKKYEGKFSAGYEKHREELFENMKRLGIVPKTSVMSPAAPMQKRWDELSPDEKKYQERLMEVYAAMVDNIDMNIGKVVAELKKSGAYDNTMIFYFHDNGPSPSYMDFYPGNADGKWIAQEFDTSYENLGAPKSYAGVGPGWAAASSAPFKLFKFFMTEGGTLSPMIVKGPAVSKPGSINDAFLGVEDIYPTILELANAERSETRNGIPLAPLKGVSFANVLQGKADSARPDNFERGEELFNNKVYRMGKWKLSWLPKPFGEERWQLFDMDNDRTETRDLASQHPEIVEEMVKKYEVWAKEHNVLNWDSEFLAQGLFNYFDWRKGLPTQIIIKD